MTDEKDVIVIDDDEDCIITAVIPAPAQPPPVQLQLQELVNIDLGFLRILCHLREYLASVRGDHEARTIIAGFMQYVTRRNLSYIQVRRQ